MPTVLITGASGYIGQHLALKLMADGWQVRGLAHSARPPLLSQVGWVQCDLDDAPALMQAVQGCDAVVHLACLPLAASRQNPDEAMRVNGVGTLRVLEAAHKAGAGRVIYTSTGQVYGGQAALPNDEANAPDPDSPYAASKLCGEAWRRAFAASGEMKVHVLRLFNVYGAAADGSLRPTVESIFLRQLLRGEQPVVRGNLEEGRDFVHMDDVIAAIRLVLAREGPSETFNVGTGVCTTMFELAQQCARVLGAATEPIYEPTEQPVARFCATTERAERMLGFRTTISLAEGLLRSLGSMKDSIL